MNVFLFAIAAFNFLFVTFVIWKYRKRLDNSFLILSFFLLGKGLTLISNLIFNLETELPLLWRSMAIFLYSFLFSYAPFVYFFSKQVTTGFIFKTKHAIHFAPFVIFLFLNLTLILQINVFDNQSLIADLASIIDKYTYLYFIQVIAYSIAGYYLLLKNEKIDEQFKKSFKWVKHLVLLFIIVWFLFLSSTISFSVFNNDTLAQYLEIFGLGFLIVLSNLTLFTLFRNPELFYNDLSLKKNTIEITNDLLTKDSYDKLCQIILKKELHKESNLKVADLANEIGLSARNTSLLIKEYHKGNFYDYINSFRIEEAKKMLLNKNNDLTILSIIYESGFNSKSVFNTVFKKSVGMTPSEFRQLQTED
ncbi:helix-turn-helix transcriptional regulator [Bizionia echini]|uniref:helix-turn-helix transcriptional regulator n=1 Tax=Bizionia echini TaxID=649333 RepID=UPI0030DB65E0